MDYKITKQHIANGNFLPIEDMVFLDNSISEIQDNWKKRQIFRTETEMRISVLNDNKFPTKASKYWQCIREQSAFYESLVRLSFDFRRNRLDEMDLIEDIQQSSGNDKLRLEIDLEELQFARLNMEQVALDRVRELRLWAQLMDELDDGSFDNEDVNTHQLVSYTQRFEHQMKNLDFASISEANNLKGQYESALKLSKEKSPELISPATSTSKLAFKY